MRHGNIRRHIDADWAQGMGWMLEECWYKWFPGKWLKCLPESVKQRRLLDILYKMNIGSWFEFSVGLSELTKT